MKVHQLARGVREHEPSLSLGCKRLRPLAPKLPHTHNPPFDLKTFIRPESGPIKLSSSNSSSSSSHDTSKDNPSSPQQQVETHPGGTRWNPTQSQIGILEMLYRGGMRTPNAQQIEQITAQLGNYGKIEGKNVFYWFQNHKARERQKHKRNTTTTTLALSPSPITAFNFDTPTTLPPVQRDVVETEEHSPYKKKCRSWAFDGFHQQMRSTKEEHHTTLELFPLHPEGR